MLEKGEAHELARIKLEIGPDPATLRGHFRHGDIDCGAILYDRAGAHVGNMPFNMSVTRHLVQFR